MIPERMPLIRVVYTQSELNGMISEQEKKIKDLDLEGSEKQSWT